MEKIDILRQHGLFDARTPRYTSYPPANHFTNGVGQQSHATWVAAVPQDSDISVYVHIPFCSRLCWFCACRTQGTTTSRPVNTYIATLLKELDMVRKQLPDDVRMGRLHLGGGTPSILSPQTMAKLLSAIFEAFPKTGDFEFSVEIDPTEAAYDLLETLADFGMNRASVGVQDFAPDVQQAIGRLQSPGQTNAVINRLRASGVQSLNIDLLYGLPHQTRASFRATLEKVARMAPDRLAIYGYAHVPWMSKRQVMIDCDTLPDPQARFALAEQAREYFTARGYNAIGIDHFALPGDSLSQADRNGRLRRNFQGYTDDQSRTLIGLGASAISRFEQGFIQNAAATAAYQDRINGGQLAGQKGYAMARTDDLVAQMIEDLMCRFRFEETKLAAQFPSMADVIHRTRASLLCAFPNVFWMCEGELAIVEDAKPLARIIARFIDTFTTTQTAHAAAI